ncbi:hypothetical protein GCM10022234_09060 [Aeromicrobium panaciterrae]|uniref:TetR/AcrR family transcriptional regulator n=1 Tax=Aeromicrobium panaciterrae TaxID=363861 RepID=UPI0031E3B80F
MADSFSRARTPEQRAVRSDAIRAAARELLTSTIASQVTLRAIAGRAGLAPSNVLRHGGSREEILLDVMDEQYAGWLDELERSLGRDATTEKAASTMAESLAGHPVLLTLIEESPELLRHVAPGARVLEQGHRHQQRLASIVERALGVELRPGDRALLVAGLHASVAGAAAWSRQGVFASSQAGAVRDLLAIQLEGLAARARRSG